MHDPENIHLIMDEFRIRLAQKQIKQRSLAMRLKFVAMRMVKESDVLFGQRFAGAIEDSGGFAAGFLVKIALVRYPSAAGILQTERPGFARDSFGVIAVPLERKVSANRFQAI